MSKEVYPHPVFSRGYSPPEESKRGQGKLNSAWCRDKIKGDKRDEVMFLKVCF